MGFETLLKDARIWRFGEVPAGTDAVPSGFAALDGRLPGGGWPVGALTEIFSGVEGIGALRLVLPALARLSRCERWLAWIAPPYFPHAPALAAHGVDLRRVLIVGPVEGPAERFWALEQSMRSGACSAVLGWWSRAEWRGLRRLQLSAEAGRSCGILFRPMTACHEASPAALRLVLEPSGSCTAVRIIKRRGGAVPRPLTLDLRGPGL